MVPRAPVGRGAHGARELIAAFAAVRPMTVALDARKLHDGGIGTYIRGLLGAFGALDTHEVVALLRPEDLGRHAWGGRVREAPVRAGLYGLAEHWVVPGAARRAGANLLHAPHYTLPLGWRGRAVVTIHDLIHVRFPRFFPAGATLYARAMAGTAVRRARRVIVDSEHARREVIELLGAPERKLTVIPLGVSPALARPAPEAIEAFRAARGLPRDYLLYVGARKRHKNVALLLEALARMPEGSRPPLVLGGAPFDVDEPLGRLARSLGVGRTLDFAGDPDDEQDLACLYGGAALYVHPSLAEGFGLPPLEAMACGTPVLSSNAGALPEVVGEAGVLLEPRDPEAWARAIERLLGDAEQRARLAVAGVERAARFTWECTARRTAEVYDEALARG